MLSAHCKLHMKVIDGGSFWPPRGSCCGSAAGTLCFCSSWAAASGPSARRDSPWKYAPCEVFVQQISFDVSSRLQYHPTAADLAKQTSADKDILSLDVAFDLG